MNKNPFNLCILVTESNRYVYYYHYHYLMSDIVNFLIFTFISTFQYRIQ